jgi:hypothetical protein
VPRLEYHLTVRVLTSKNAAVDVIAQWVRTLWTKRSRGGLAAAQRNAVPIGFPLPDTHSPLVHAVLIAEWDDFKPQESLHYGEPDQADVLLDEADDRLRVELVINPNGAPSRWRRPPAVRLSRGEWVRWQVNYRIPYEAGWSYRLDTLNLAYGPVSQDVFTGAPTFTVDERASLR